MQGQVAIITGAGRGIGRAIALGLAQAGAAVVLVARREADLAEVAQDVTRAGGKALAVAGDVAEEASAAAALKAAHDSFGRVDILINNAGHNTLGRLTELPVADWWRQIEVNLKGTYLFSRAVIPGMVQRRSGRIVNVSSVAGKQGVLYGSAYTAAKHAIVGFTRALALEVAEEGITVNAICPGYVATDLTDYTMDARSKLFGKSREAVVQGVLARVPQKVVLKPEDCVGAVRFLCSEAAARITGEAMNISAGMVMH